MCVYVCPNWSKSDLDNNLMSICVKAKGICTVPVQMLR